MIDPKTIIVMTPSHHGEVCTGYVSGMLQCADLYGGHSFIVGMSEINKARNLMVHAFLNLPVQFEWLVTIDADIEFSRQDFELLCEDIPFEVDDKTHAIVTAEYARRPIDDRKAVRRGPAKLALGFARTHRSVFEELRDVKNADNETLVNSFFNDGQIVYDYFPSGAQASGHWLSEDHGFFTLCQIAGIVPRIETRTNLVHWGRHGARYESGEVRSPLRHSHGVMSVNSRV